MSAQALINEIQQLLGASPLLDVSPNLQAVVFGNTIFLAVLTDRRAR